MKRKVIYLVLIGAASSCLLSGCGDSDDVSFSYTCGDGSVSTQSDPKTAYVGCSEHGGTNQRNPDLAGSAEALETQKVTVDAWREKGARITTK